MAIQNRRGVYSKFDPTKMLSGEFAIVQSGDPNSTSGRALYVCIEPGVVKRVADYEDLQDLVADVAEGYIQDFDDAVDAVTTLIPATTQAKNDANDAAAAANAAAQSASAIVLGGNAAQGYGYGVCDTSSTTSNKTVSITGFVLSAGGIVSVKFHYETGTFSTLNVNSTGAKTVKYMGSDFPVALRAGDTGTFIYDGTYYHLIAIDRVRPIWMNLGTVSSLPITKNDSNVKTDMKCVKAVLGTPSAQTGDWTVTTSDGSVTVSGSISGSTTLEIMLESVRSYSIS